MKINRKLQIYSEKVAFRKLFKQFVTFFVISYCFLRKYMIKLVLRA